MILVLKIFVGQLKKEGTGLSQKEQKQILDDFRADKFNILVADWFAWMNNKLEGDQDKIRITGEYFIEVWKACGLDTNKINIIWSKEFMADDEYWKKPNFY